MVSINSLLFGDPTFLQVLQVISQESELESNLRRQVCDLRAELGGISIVDEFAKYAKIQRKINKMSEELSHQGILDMRFLNKCSVYSSCDPNCSELLFYAFHIYSPAQIYIHFQS